MTHRPVALTLTAQPASDGAGVRLHRIQGPDGMRRLDPFLLLDEFASDSPDDYIAGFPPHPHRGFETVTYMLAGQMLHEDHLGGRGLLGPGDVQWMTAGRGVIHSEMPRQDQGRMHGFQLWVNLPAAQKMQPARYRHIPADAIPEVPLAGGGRARLVAGRLAGSDGEVTGPAAGIATDPLYLDLELPAGADLELPLDPGHTALVYLYEGELRIGDQDLGPRRMAVLGAGDSLAGRAGPAGARALVLAARPLAEPVAHYGPFVMNTRSELEQAMADYQAGRLTD